ncbi:MAG TPA: aldo/keto reductase [Methanoregulaceae archaeon]|nr:aldo/keto reductase [Methanoregulaceae archaeon]
MRTSGIPERPRVGLGGEGVLRTTGREAGAMAVITEALDRGIRYFDSARAYADSELYHGMIWGERQTRRDGIFLTSKSASRSYAGAFADLTQTLARMRTDYLDLWQIHDLRTRPELRAIEEPHGALRAFLEAKEAGLVKQIGVTGHHDPTVLAEAVERWPVDTVLLPVNPVEAVLGGFVDRVLETAVAAGVAPIGMKVLGRGHYVAPDGGITAEILIRYALGFPIRMAIVGCDTTAEVAVLLRAAAAGPLEPSEADALVEAFRPAARRLAYYRGIL